MSVDLQDFEMPANDAEKQRVIQAIYDERQRAEGDALVEGLTDRERHLIQAAWRAGALAAKDDLSKRLTSPHAVTLDAASVQRVVDSWNTAFTGIPFAHDFPNAHRDERLVSLVRRVDRLLEETREQA
jgi:hypothetical protein